MTEQDSPKNIENCLIYGHLKMGTQTQYLTNLQSHNSKKMSSWWQNGRRICHIGPNALKLCIQLLKAQKLKVNEYGLKMFPNYLFYQEKLSGGVLKTPPLWLIGLTNWIIIIHKNSFKQINIFSVKIYILSFIFYV